MDGTSKQTARIAITDSTVFLAQQFERDKETWKSQHDEAMACFDLQDVLAAGVLRGCDEEFMHGNRSWSLLAMNGERRVQRDEHGGQVRRMYDGRRTRFEDGVVFVQPVHRVADSSTFFKALHLIHAEVPAAGALA